MGQKKWSSKKKARERNCEQPKVVGVGGKSRMYPKNKKSKKEGAKPRRKKKRKRRADQKEKGNEEKKKNQG